MSGLAGLVTFGERRELGSQLARMLSQVPHRGGEGEDRIVSEGAAFGFVRRGTGAGCEGGVVSSQEGSVIVAVDGNLYGEHSAAQSAAVVIAESYERRELRLFDHLDGEYAFAIWDGRRRRLILARDPFGEVPLYYTVSGDAVAFSSEPKQLLSLGGVVEVDRETVGDYLTGRFSSAERTFFAAIKRVPAATFLTFAGESVRSARHWHPESSDFFHGNEERYLSEFRELLIASVRKRVRASHPVCFQMSGGLDSPSLAVAAGELARRHEELAGITMVSAVFPGSSVDESPYIDALERVLPFPVKRVDPRDGDPIERLEEELRLIDSPFADLQAPMLVSMLEVASAERARTLVTGLGGDEILAEPHYFRDLGSLHRWWQVVPDAWRARRYSYNPFLTFVGEAIRGAVPERAKRLLRRVRKHASWRAPDWFARDFARFYASTSDLPPPEESGFRTESQRWMYRYFTYPHLTWVFDALDARCAARGVRPRHPFFDRPLAEYALRIPFEARMCRGEWKHLARRGLRDLLPPEIRERRLKTKFDDFSYEMLRRVQPLWSEVTTAPQWFSADFVDRNAAAKLSFARRDFLTDGQTIWKLLTLEMWLRTLLEHRSTKGKP